MKKVIIIGAGISGLFLANLLEKSGNYDYKILEKKNNLNLYDGYGVQISVNGIKLLNKIGFKEISMHDINNPNYINFYDAKNCNKISHINISKFNDKENYYTTLKRSQLIDFLIKSIPKKKILFNTSIKGIEGNDTFKINLDNSNFLHADYLAVCDGVFSKSKSFILNDDVKAKYYNSVALRGTIKNYKNKDISVYLGPNFHFVIYPINQNYEANFISIIREKNFLKLAENSKEELTRIFINRISKNTSYDLKSNLLNVSLYPVYVSQKLSKPSNKNIFLAGDALFAFPPSFAQGTSQSIQASNEVFKNIDEGFNDYYKKRALITKSVKYRCQINHFAFHLSSPITVFVRNIALKFLTKNDNFLKNYLGRIYR